MTKTGDYQFRKTAMVSTAKKTCLIVLRLYWREKCNLKEFQLFLTRTHFYVTKWQIRLELAAAHSNVLNRHFIWAKSFTTEAASSSGRFGSPSKNFRCHLAFFPADFLCVFSDGFEINHLISYTTFMIPIRNHWTFCSLTILAFLFCFFFKAQHQQQRHLTAVVLHMLDHFLASSNKKMVFTLHVKNFGDG